jgi:hypothetical protein
MDFLVSMNSTQGFRRAGSGAWFILMVNLAGEQSASFVACGNST